jgi:hypothetical protein
MRFYEDPSLSGFARLSPLCEARKASRCFRTTADGRIPLTGNWLELLAAARLLGWVAIQTRHAYARLVAFREMSDFSVCPRNGYLQSVDGSLRFNFENNHRAWGRLAECECCGTPGRLELHNAHALEFFQLCPISGCTPAAWADFLATTALDGEFAHSLVTPGPVAESFPRLPACSRLISNRADDVVPLLLALGDEGVPLRCLLRTEEALHSRGFATTHVDVTDGVLTAGEKGARFQIGLPAVRALVLSDSPQGWMLHFTGPGDTSLLALTAPAEAGSQAAWREALRNAFPQIS